jgi:hypothetical protein
MPDGHVDVVARIKAELEARGVSLVGPCGAFAITRRVAWALRAEGAGLLSKPAGNNCEGFATDIICYPDGRIFDILINGGGDEAPDGSGPIAGTGNLPAWQTIAPVEASRYRPAVDPGDAPATAASGSGPAPAQTPATSASDSDRTVAAIEKSTAAILAALKENTETLISVRKGLEQSLGALLPVLLGRPPGAGPV